ncbi:hypothetical protein GSI_08316 [Ganoderma sinense ZZ0214-1]|uniref:NadR/Ttd14 AAA domain-containing protein n=1 Tax=Ganoderma sinense ZZ0214-1 TaxID=1077348 RepID=A0A2G8S7H9_9APHY|nr:hypothetical protein GSI_08316 [Ganoderma sinense ZZ0214-1]
MYIKEVARTVMKTRQFTRDDVDTYEMQHAIMEAQLAAERTALASAMERPKADSARLILSDRSAIDPCVYAATSRVPGAETRSQRLLQNAGFREMVPFYRRSLFVVLESVPEWIEDDGVRSLEEPQRYSEGLQRILSELGIAYIALGESVKDLDERVSFVTGKLARMGRASPGSPVAYVA